MPGVFDGASSVAIPGLTGAVARLSIDRARDAVSVKEFGALGNNTGDDLTAFQKAANAQIPIYVPDGIYPLSSWIAARDGSEFYGSRNAILRSTSGAERSIFYANNITYFRVQGLTLKGNPSWSASGTIDPINRSAIVVWDVTDCDVLDVTFDRWTGSGVNFGVNGNNYFQSGTVRGCRFLKGDMSNAQLSGGIVGLNDNAAVQIYTGSRNVIVDDNLIEGAWANGVLIQDILGTNLSKPAGMRVTKNVMRQLEVYGIAAYGRTQTFVTNLAANAASEFRVTTEIPHGHVTGDQVHVRGCGAANGVWWVVRIDDTVLDLIGSTYQSGITLVRDPSGANINVSVVQPIDMCSALIAENVIDTVVGRRDSGANKPFGHAIYLASIGSIIARANTLIRSNQMTTGATLPPGSISIGDPSGPVEIDGTLIIDSGRQALSVSKGRGFAPLRISRTTVLGGNDEYAALLIDAQQTSVSDFQFVPDNRRVGGRFRAQNSLLTAVPGLKLSGIRAPGFRAAQSNMIEVNGATDYEIADCLGVNLKPSTQAMTGLRVTNSSKGVIRGNQISNGAAAYPAAEFSDVTNTVIEGNRFQAATDSNNRPTVTMVGDCAGTAYEQSNRERAGSGQGLVNNGSTGGAMHTRAPDNTSGHASMVRQKGDTITNTSPNAGGTAGWVKTTSGAGTTNYDRVVLTT